MTKIIDTAASVTSRLPQLKAAGVETVIRYLTTATASYKIVRPEEARAIAQAGLKLGLVFEDYGGTRGYSDINAGFGKIHAELCLRWAPMVGAPDRTIIWFAVDTDAHGAQITDHIVPYFRAIKSTMGERYRAGIYGCGAACAAALDAAVVDAAWLSNARGWNGYQAFLASNRWVLLQHLPVKIGGLDVDPDDGQGDTGAFVPFGEAAAPEPIAPPAKPLLAKGSTGPFVQELLTRLKLEPEFGDKTDAAVRKFQAAHGLLVDGVVGDQTWTALG